MSRVHDRYISLQRDNAHGCIAKNKTLVALAARMRQTLYSSWAKSSVFSGHIR